MNTTKSIMTTPVICVNTDDPIRDVFQSMLDNSVSGVPVVDDEQKLVGLVSEYDLMGILYGSNLAKAKARDYMTSCPDSVSPDVSLADLTDLFLSSTRRRLPVVEDDKLIGIVSRRDLVRVALVHLDAELTASCGDPLSVE